MLKKEVCSTILSLILSLGLTAVACAEHGSKDPYEAMCQSTGCYSTSKAAFAHNTHYTMQLFGHCGEQPNILVMDEYENLSHSITVWKSPKKNHPYWKQVYRRYYDFDKQGNIVKTWKDIPDDTSFIDVLIEQPFTLTVKRYCSAKKGSPIFPHAAGNLQCPNGVEDQSVLEQGYQDYLKDVK